MSELWLKEKKVLTLKDMEGVPKDIVKIDNPELLPLCLKRECTWESFNKWMKSRCMPEDREGRKEVIEKNGTSWLEIKNYASLSDQYWIRKREEPWKKINFFTNIYSNAIGNMFFEPWLQGSKKIEDTPDQTTNGILRKRWVQDTETKKSRMIKAGSKRLKQEPLSEVLVSVFVEQLGTIQSAGYDLCVEGGVICSVCDNFITEDTELVPASYIYFDEPKKDNEKCFEHLIRMCEKHEIPDAENYIKWLVFIDHCTGNTDRNLSNIGFIRDINTMKFIGPSPLYDCGNAYIDTKKMNEGVKGDLFGDMEANILKELKKCIDLEAVFKGFGYKKLISAYPDITETKKENLIEVIGKKNNNMIKSQVLVNSER